MSTHSQSYKLPLDLVGNSPTNLIVNERQIVDDRHRQVLPASGAYYTDSLVITYRGERLRPHVDYAFSRIDDEAVKLTGKSVSRLIFIKTPVVRGEIILSYQAVGERFSKHDALLMKLISEMKHDARGIHWNDIIDLPTHFQAMRHLHHVHDIYGLTPIFEGFMEVSKAIQHAHLRQDKHIWMELTHLKEEVDELAWIDPVKLKRTFDEHDALMKRVDDTTDPLVTTTFLTNTLAPHITTLAGHTEELAGLQAKLAETIESNQSEHAALQAGIDRAHQGNQALLDILNAPVLRNVVNLNTVNPTTPEEILKIEMIGRFGFKITHHRHPELDVLKSRLDEANAAGLEMANAIADNKAKLGINTNQIANHANILQQAQTDIRAQAERLNDHDGRLTRLHSANQQQDRNHTDLANKLAELDRREQNSSNAINSRLTQEINEVNANHSGLVNRVATLESEQVVQDTKLRELDSKIDAQKSDAISQARTETERQVSELNGQLAPKIEANKNALDEHKTQLDNHAQNLQTHTGELAQHSNALELLTAMDTALDDEQRIQNERLDEIEKRIVTARIEFDKTGFVLNGVRTSHHPAPIMILKLGVENKTVTSSVTGTGIVYAEDVSGVLSSVDYNSPVLYRLSPDAFRNYAFGDMDGYLQFTDVKLNESAKWCYLINVLQLRGFEGKETGLLAEMFLRWLLDVQTGSNRALWIGCVKHNDVPILIASVEETGYFTFTLQGELGYLETNVNWLSSVRALLQYRKYDAHNQLIDNHINFLINGELRHLNNSISNWNTYANKAAVLANQQQTSAEGVSWLYVNTLVANSEIALSSEVIFDQEGGRNYNDIEVTFDCVSISPSYQVFLKECDGEGLFISHGEEIELIREQTQFDTYPTAVNSGYKVTAHRVKYRGTLSNTDLGFDKHFRLVIILPASTTEQPSHIGNICMTYYKANNRYNPGPQVVIKEAISSSETMLLRQELRRIIAEQSRAVDKEWDLSKFVEQPGAENFSSITVDENNVLHATGVILQSLAGGETSSVFAPSQQIVVTSTQEWSIPTSLVGKKAEIIIRARSADGPNGTIIHSATRKTFIDLPAGKVKLMLGGLTSFGKYLTVNQNEDYEDALTPRLHSAGGKHSNATITINV